ncbi:MAG: L-aspartate oxidase [Patescibacteria group bacterium]|nr:L-aspartate oxidase [Patescibacteria group bacterium]
MQKQEILKADVLIIGAGIAGSVAALELAEDKEIRVLLVTKEKNIQESATFYAQGGIVGRGENDTEEKLRKDILNAGAGLCNEQAVEIIAKEGPQLIERILIKKANVKFNKNEKNKYDHTREAAHSEKRILYSGDNTGKEIETKLIKAVKNRKNIKILADCTLVDLLTLPHHAVDSRKIYENKKCAGCYLLNNKNGQIKIVLTKKTVLATGGIGQVYLRTTNPAGITGDGLAAANRAGAEVINAEYVQFHPTSLFHRDGNNFLISEAVRGEGGKLKNGKSEPFMKKYDKRGSLAPRDIVARGIYEEILNGKNDFVYLDLAFCRKPNFIKKRFPNIYRTCLDFGIDITKEKIPVAPTAHYFCGGIRVDEFGRSSLENLFALGEVSCTGAHGANRLASVSLLEGLVWAKRCADCAMRELKNSPLLINEKEVKPWTYIGCENSDPALIKQDWMNVKSIMWNYVGIVRTSERLERAVADLNYLNHRVEKFYRYAQLSQDLLELRNGIQTALIIAKAAKRNNESRGCHYISKY